jgi:hypothetical protein
MEITFVKAVGALNDQDAQNIITSDSISAYVCVPVNLQLLRRSPHKFIWKYDEEVMNAIDRESLKGPFTFIVLFFLYR